MSMKNPLTPAGIEAAAFRFVAQHLNHCATLPRSIDSPTCNALGNYVSQNRYLTYTVIPRLTKIIRSGFTFVSRNLSLAET